MTRRAQKSQEDHKDGQEQSSPKALDEEIQLGTTKQEAQEGHECSKGNPMVIPTAVYLRSHYGFTPSSSTRA